MSSINEENRDTPRVNIAGYCRIGISDAIWSANTAIYLPANDGNKDNDANDHWKLILPDIAG